MLEIKLQFPIQSEGRTINSLRLRRMKVKDRLLMDKIPGSEAEKEIKLFAHLCELAPETIESLDMQDFVAIQEAVYGPLS
jgi:hypothetical protein